VATEIRAAVLREPGEPLTIERLQLAAPGPEEVLVRIEASGVCHSDLSLAKGNLSGPLPIVLGHEGAGVVEEIGPGVTGVEVGDHVVLLFRAACGKCRMCEIGRPALCPQGARLRKEGTMVDGTTRLSRDGETVYHYSGASSFAERAVVPLSAVVRVPSELPLVELSVVGCAVMTGVGAVFNAAGLEPGSHAMVIGCGGVGISAVQGAAIAGASTILAVDLNPDRLELARKLGATHTVVASEADPVEVATELEIDYAFDTAGAIATMRTAVASIRPGGTAVAIGVPPLSQMLEVDAAALVVTEKTLRGCFYGSSEFRRDVPLLLDLYRSGRLDLNSMVGEEVGLDDVNGALRGLETDALARTVIRP
jgi:S-(hydroxymethyl)glutathione dehydrogenase/alcohol dehydrogenase